MSKVLATLAIILVATFAASAADNSYKICNDKVTVTVKDLAPNADMTALKACYDIKVASDAIDNCESIIISPVVKSGSEKQLVEIIVVNGPGRVGLTPWLSRQLYRVCDPNNVRVFTMKEGEDLYVKTCTEVRFDDWMNDAEFDVTTQKATYNPNCIKSLAGEEFICYVPYLKEPLKINAQLKPFNFDFTPTGHRTVSTRLFYPVNGTQRVDSYLENADALALLGALDQPNYSVSSIDINGYASPESSVAYNKALSEKRAATLKKIIADKYNFDAGVYHIEGKGENWDAIKDFIDNTDNSVITANKAAINEALESSSNLDAVEAAIKKIDGGKVYSTLFKDAYPRSRYADCVVKYNVKEFDLNDAKVIYKNDPKALTATDYAHWMSQEYDPQVAAKALSLYPNDKELNAVVANGEYMAGKYNQAIEHFKKAGNAPEVMNNLGCCYLQTGDAEAAKACFEKAGNMKEAEENAEEVRKVVLNNRYFAE